MKPLIIVLIALCLVGCAQKHNPNVSRKVMPESYGVWTIEQNPRKYYYTIYLSEKDFVKIWEIGMDIKLLPQK